MTRNSGRNPKSPAYQWYPTDALTDADYAALTYEEVGVFHKLIDFSWLNNGIPADTDRLARLLKLTDAEFARIWVNVSRCFKPKKKDATRLVNARQERERKSQASFKRKMRDNANKTNDKRRNGDTPRDTPGARHASPERDAERTLPNPVSRVPSGTDNNSRSTRGRVETHPAGSEHDALKAWWIERYAKAAGGARYAWHRVNDPSLANELLKRARESGRGLDLVQEVIEHLIEHPRFGLELPTLARAVGLWNYLVARPSASKPVPKPSSGKSAEQQTLEREVERRWCAKHTELKRVPGFQNPMPCCPPYIGFEDAKRELDEDDASDRGKETA